MRGMTIYLYELAWILPSVAIPTAMLVALMVTAFGAGIHLPGVEGRVDPTKLAETAPFNEPALAAQVLAMVLFAFGGISGLVNASYNVNLVVHNTAWVPGRFHLTVGTAVTLTFMGISYWLVPNLSGRALWNRRLALAQVWLWFTGMAIFSNALHRLGLMGMPCRTMIGSADYLALKPDWHAVLPLVGLGGPSCSSAPFATSSTSS
jgi:heme/copper-type cytochrome/quinol oxidase subunit 1